MQGQERILRERFAHAACDGCGANHQPDDMLVLAKRESRWLVLLVCRQCRRRSIFVASFPHPSSPHHISTPLDPVSAPTTYDLTSPAADQDLFDLSHAEGDLHHSPVTEDDVEVMRAFLDQFDGDFHALFGPPEGRALG